MDKKKKFYNFDDSKGFKKPQKWSGTFQIYKYYGSFSLF